MTISSAIEKAAAELALKDGCKLFDTLGSIRKGVYLARARACIAAYLREMSEPTQAMKEAALDESGARVSAYEAPRESGVPVECDISEADAEQINADLMESFADTFRAMRLAEAKSVEG